MQAERQPVAPRSRAAGAAPAEGSVPPGAYGLLPASFDFAVAGAAMPALAAAAQPQALQLVTRPRRCVPADRVAIDQLGFLEEKLVQKRLGMMVMNVEPGGIG